MLPLSEQKHDIKNRTKNIKKILKNIKMQVYKFFFL